MRLHLDSIDELFLVIFDLLSLERAKRPKTRKRLVDSSWLVSFCSNLDDEIEKILLLIS